MTMRLYKHITHILYTVAAVAVVVLSHACTNYEYRRELLAADSLISENPEKATAMLDSMKAEMPTAPEHERMYYELLRIKAADKAYETQKSDSTILKLIDYYENGGDTRILPEAYYYAGSVYRDMNDAPRAIDFFQKAEDKLSGSENYRLLSNINAQKGFIFSKQYLYREALQAHFKAYKYDCLLKDTVNIVYSLIFLANTYKNIEKADSSIMFFQKAASLATKTNNKEVIGDANAQMASLYIKQKDYKSALKLLSQNLNDTANTEKSPNYSMAVKIYMQTHQYDSAYKYCNELMDIGTIYAKQTASNSLAKIYMMKRDYTNANKYMEIFKTCTDSILKITATESVARMNSLYNYNLREKENLELKAESASRLNIILLALLLIVALLIVLFTFVITVRRKSKEQMERLKRIKKEIHEQSEEYINKNKAKIADLEASLKASVNENKMQADLIEQQKAELILTNKKAEYKQSRNEAITAVLARTPIYETIMQRIKTNKALRDEEWETLDETINTEIKNFKQRIKEIHNVSKQEYRICLLIRIGIPIKDMAVIMSLSASGISKARIRLKDKFFGKEGTTKDFDSFVNSL